MDIRKPRDGQAIEEVGTYDPMVRDKSKRVTLKMDRIEYWLSVGAQPSDKVATLIKKVKMNKFGTSAAPPPLTPPKEPPAPEPAEEAAAEESAEAPAAEATVEAGTESEPAVEAEAGAEEKSGES